MTHRGPFQPLLLCDSVFSRILQILWLRVREGKSYPANGGSAAAPQCVPSVPSERAARTWT